MIYGRRRAGKTYFLQHALEGRRGIYFLAAESSSVENLEELLAQIRCAFSERPDVTRENYPSWRVALRLLCELANRERLLVVFDEFSYLVGVDPSLPSILQAVWDQDARSSQVKLVLCGSEIGLLGALDDYGRPFHGRFDWVAPYRPLDYYDAARFLRAGASSEQAYGPRDVLLAYGLLGGSGRYLATVDPTLSLAENIAQLLLDPLGIFQREGEILICQERDIRDYANYNAVLEAIAGGATDGSVLTYIGRHPDSTGQDYRARRPKDRERPANGRVPGTGESGPPQPVPSQRDPAATVPGQSCGDRGRNARVALARPGARQSGGGAFAIVTAA